MCFFTNLYDHKPSFIHKKLTLRLSDTFHQEALQTIGDQQSKLRTYGLLKSKIGMENYLLKIKNPVIRSTFTKFRLSNHSLMIEIGRHQKIPKELRFCPFCKNSVESEIHFLVNCSIYEPIRSEILIPILNKRPSIYLTEKEKFQYLLSEEHIQIMPTYIQKCMDLRTFLLQHPKRGL